MFAVFYAGLHRVPLDQSLNAFLEEASLVMFDCVEKVLRNSGVAPREVCQFPNVRLKIGITLSQGVHGYVQP
jgi:hypothetical protein